MQAQDFIRKWAPGGTAHELNERAGAQAHFIDLCRLLGMPEPADPQRYCFERGVVKTGSLATRTDGYADVWLQGHFAWEYKAPGKSLEGALKQLMQYALPLDNPPLLVVSDRLRIEVHTHFTGTPSERHVFLLEELGRPDVQQRLRALWLSPDDYRPRRSNRDITEEAARTFAGTAERLRAAGVAPEGVSHFLTQCLFCFFAEDVGLLPARLFERLVGVAITPAQMQVQLGKLFEAMRDGGLFGVDAVPWFNGGLFQRIAVPALTDADVAALKVASALNWSAIDPSIFGTLFERGLDPGKRAQLGAHYTDPATILLLVEPVVRRPLLTDWVVVKAEISARLAKRDQLRADAELIPSTTQELKKKFGKVRTRANEEERKAQRSFADYLERLRDFRVLDPACGSGNFLYLALKCLKDIEHQVNLEAENLGLERQHDVTGPHNVLGIELNEYAAELARVTVWIGELQWRIQQGYGFKLNPVLEPLDHIENRDALINADGSEAAWPKADAVVGNPPFVGDKKMRGELGDAYTEQLRATYKGRVPGGADLVCYWFEKARAQIEAGVLQRAGLVSTNSIRGGKNREVLDRVCVTTRIFEAWSDEPWVNEGAGVRVSLIGFGHSNQGVCLDGETVSALQADLSAGSSAEVSSASKLVSNAKSCFIGAQQNGPFTIGGEMARAWLREPTVGGKPMSDVVRPWRNGKDLSDRASDQWIIDFGLSMSEQEAALLSLPFDHVAQHVKPMRLTGNRESRKKYWWRLGEPSPALRIGLASIARFAATPRVAKHRVWSWLPTCVIPDVQVVAVARADDTTFGILHSRFHELWSLRLGTSLEDRPRYTPTTCFETFPFPAGLTPADTAYQRTEALDGGALVPAGLAGPTRTHAEAIARAAQRLNTLREAWLNPPEWTERVPEVVPLGLSTSPYPDRILLKPGFEKELAKRTMTNLYNQRPTWLAQAHEALDVAVAGAYGWADYSPATADDDILRRLLALNLARAGART